MRNRIIAGLLAGAAGTTALNAVTYADMALRGRPGSEIPEHLVEVGAVAVVLLGRLGPGSTGFGVDARSRSGFRAARTGLRAARSCIRVRWSTPLGSDRRVPRWHVPRPN